MARDLVTYGNLKAGKLSIVGRDQFMNALHTWPDGEVSLTIKPVGRRRSSPANRYYHGVVVPMIVQAMSEVWGEELDNEEVHELLKRRFNSRMIDTEDGKIKIVMSTSRLTSAEFVAYTEKCRQWAAQFFSIDIPDPVKITTANQELKV